METPASTLLPTFLAVSSDIRTSAFSTDSRVGNQRKWLEFFVACLKTEPARLAQLLVRLIEKDVDIDSNSTDQSQDLQTLWLRGLGEEKARSSSYKRLISVYGISVWIFSTMETFALGLAVISAADLCTKYGKILASRYKAYQNAEQEVSELILCLEHHCIKTKTQVTFLTTIWQDLEEELQILQNELLHVMENRLQEATRLLNRAIGESQDESMISSILKKKGRIHRKSFAIYLKERLEKSVKELERWHGMFDVSWFLIIRVTSQSIDDHLTTSQSDTGDALVSLRSLRDASKASQPEGATQSIFIPPTYISDERDPIRHSSSRVSQVRDEERRVIVDTVPHYPFADLALTTEAIRDLARLLSNADPSTMGLLACRGVVKVVEAGTNIYKFDFVYSIPHNLSSPRSLRDLLMNLDQNHPLDERFSLAKRLAKSVLYLHTSRFVHKNIRPETILVFQKNDLILGEPFLSGFENFRPVAGRTYQVGDNVWEKDLYRHPSRQGLQPLESYKMQHDIYSLGLCLLEIGLWTSFVVWNEAANSPEPDPDLHIAPLLALKNQRKKAHEIKNRFISMAEGQLPSKMGKIYAETTVSCLTCLDSDNRQFGDESEFSDEDGILVGIRYIEKILLALEEITI